MWFILGLVNSISACSLCPLRVPPRPRPLDQYKLPSIPDLNLESMPLVTLGFVHAVHVRPVSIIMIMLCTMTDSDQPLINSICFIFFY
ncbi:hypothetical protein DICVIV_01325 [Dictyocaulus viviparus]|uniref:Uncharacterized protein n=1 Tax=Dictyocaulus viviparus TaxID=29172 RepID=A0A0D8Y905_DICVI|nr:hypothetical protein DICVIV_01325 [Dictyocaulus viviparus]